MLKKLLPHFILAGTFSLLTLSQQYLFYALKEIPIVWLPMGKYLAIFLFLFGATFIKQKGLRFFFLSLVIGLNYFQMAHLSYFGTQILPSEIGLIFSQFHEIEETLLVELHHILIPLAFTIIPGAIGLYAFRKSPKLFGSKIIGILFCLYFIYNPIRTYVTGNTWGRQPSTRELAGMNVYLSLSYFTGRILPQKILKNKNNNSTNSSTGLNFISSKESEWDKVIFILGESLSPHQMSLFGYQRGTTPFLDGQKNNPNFFHVMGLSGGVSTDISVAFFLNMGFGEAGSIKAAKGQHCFFKMAKEKKFSTHFHSAQSAQQLRYIAPYLCSSSLDDFKALEDVAPNTIDHLAAMDRDLLPALRTLMADSQKRFIMLHQRGSHGPWEVRSSPEARIFPHDSKVNHYDNSVVEFDLFMKDFFEVAQKSNKKVLAIYVSDHGEALGQDGKWGHGQLIKHAFEIPVMIMSFNHNLPAETRKLPIYASHYNVALYLAKQLGFEPNQDPFSLPQDYVIYGNDIDGLAGKAQVSFKSDNTYDFKVVE